MVDTYRNRLYFQLSGNRDASVINRHDALSGLNPVYRISAPAIRPHAFSEPLSTTVAASGPLAKADLIWVDGFDGSFAAHSSIVVGVHETGTSL